MERGSARQMMVHATYQGLYKAAREYLCYALSRGGRAYAPAVPEGGAFGFSLSKVLGELVGVKHQRGNPGI